MSGRQHKTIVPVPCLNGTALRVLIFDRQRTYEALRKTIQMLERMEPHPRDYQTAPEGTFEAAQKQHHRRWNQLILFERSLMKEIETLMDAQDASNARSKR